MARDAIARQFDVDKNAVKLVCETDSGQYRPGTVAFSAKKGKTIDLDQIEVSLRATRLSGGTSMSVTYLEVTAAGEAAADGKDVLLKGPGATRPFVLAEAPGDGKTAFRRLRDALERGEKVVSVTGRLEGWNNTFPVVLRALAAEEQAGKPRRLLVTDFQTAKEK